MTDFDQTVIEFMADMGSTVTINQVIEGAYDPATGLVGTSTIAITTKAILMDLTLQSNGLSTKYGTLVEAGDKELYMQPPHKLNGGPVIQISPASDKVTVAGIAYKIVTLKEINPTGADPILYTLYLRR